MPLDFPSSPTNGQSYAGYVYDSSLPGWRNANSDFGVQSLNTMGLKNVVPTSVVVGSGSASTNSNGTVTFSGVSSLSLNGVFSSTYTSYKININIVSSTGTSGSLAFRVRSSGTDRTTADYITSGTQAVAAGAISSYTATTTFFDMAYLYSSPTAYSNYTLEIVDVFPAIRTKMKAFSNGLSSSGVASTWTTGGLHNLDQAHDGFTILNSGGATFNGTLQVYGFTN